MFKNPFKRQQSVTSTTATSITQIAKTGGNSTIIQSGGSMTIVGSGGNTGISLTKGSNASISLAKHAEVRATLEWDGGSAFRRAKGADLELYALYVTKEQASKLSKGKGGAIYWNNLQQPGIRHHGDSLEPGVETVTITDPSKFDYVLIVAYSAISNGAGSFKSYGAKAVVTDNMSQTVTVPLFDNTESYWVAIALIDLKTDGKINIKHVETYSAGGEARPVLYTDGTFKMDVGPVEFKR